MALTDIFLRAGAVSPSDIILRDPTTADASGTTHNVDVVEAGSAVESQVAQADFLGARIEALIAADIDAAVADFLASRTEAVSVTDSSIGLAAFVGVLPETILVADAETGALVANVAVADALASAESQAVVAFFASFRIEALTASDLEHATVTNVSPLALSFVDHSAPRFVFRDNG